MVVFAIGVCTGLVSGRTGRGGGGPEWGRVRGEGLAWLMTSVICHCNLYNIVTVVMITKSAFSFFK